MVQFDEDTVQRLHFGLNETVTQKISICPLQKGYFLLPLSSLLDSVFKSKMKSKAELKIMFFFFMLHSLFVILSFSPCFFFLQPEKNLQQKEQFFESCSIVVAALRSSANATADELLVCTPFLCMAHFQL